MAFVQKIAMLFLQIGNVFKLTQFSNVYINIVIQHVLIERLKEIILQKPNLFSLSSKYLDTLNIFYKGQRFQATSLKI